MRFNIDVWLPETRLEGNVGDDKFRETIEASVEKRVTELIREMVSHGIRVDVTATVLED